MSSGASVSLSKKRIAEPLNIVTCTRCASPSQKDAASSERAEFQIADLGSGRQIAALAAPRVFVSVLCDGYTEHDATESGHIISGIAKADSISIQNDILPVDELALATDSRDQSEEGYMAGEDLEAEPISFLDEAISFCSWNFSMATRWLELKSSKWSALSKRRKVQTAVEESAADRNPADSWPAGRPTVDEICDEHAGSASIGITDSEPPQARSGSMMPGCRRRRVIGLSNLGNTCYFNAVLQNLGALEPMRKHLLLTDLAQNEMPLSRALQKFYIDTSVPEKGLRSVSLKSSAKRGGENVNKRNTSRRGGPDVSGRYNPYNPRAILEEIRVRYPRFRGGNQEDSLDLLKCLLEGVHAEELQSENRTDPYGAKERGEHGVCVDSITTFEETNTSECHVCHHASTKTQTNQCLSLPVWMLGGHGAEGSGGTIGGWGLGAGGRLHGGGGGEEWSCSEVNESQKVKSQEPLVDRKIARDRASRISRSRQAAQKDFDRLDDVRDWQIQENGVDVTGNGVDVMDSGVDVTGNDNDVRETGNEGSEGVGIPFNDVVTKRGGDSYEVTEGTILPNTLGDFPAPQPILKTSLSRDEAECQWTNFRGISSARESESGEDQLEFTTPKIECQVPAARDNTYVSTNATLHSSEGSPQRFSRDNLNDTGSRCLSTKRHTIVTVTLEDCLREYTKAERFCGENAWFCTGCTKLAKSDAKRGKLVEVNSSTDEESGDGVLASSLITVEEKEDADEWCPPVKSEMTIKRTVLDTVPPVLIFHLNRFEQDDYYPGELRKIEGHVSFEERLDMQPYLSKRDVNGYYWLMGVVSHSGSIGWGHYVAYVRGDGESTGGTPSSLGNGTRDTPWFRCSDSLVMEIRLKEVLRCEAYILFYQKQ